MKKNLMVVLCLGVFGWLCLATVDTTIRHTKQRAHTLELLSQGNSDHARFGQLAENYRAGATNDSPVHAVGWTSGLNTRPTGAQQRAAALDLHDRLYTSGFWKLYWSDLYRSLKTDRDQIQYDTLFELTFCEALIRRGITAETLEYESDKTSMPAHRFMSMTEVLAAHREAWDSLRKIEA